MIEIFIFILSFVVIILMHEILHIFMFKRLKISYDISIKKWHKIPWAIYLGSYYFGISFEGMSTKKKYEYTLIAIFPYLILLPIFMFLLLSNNIWIYCLGIVQMISHLINLPLEFIVV